MIYKIAGALEVDARGFDKQPLPNAKITLNPRKKNVTLPPFIYEEEAHGAHVARGVEPGIYTLEVSSPGLGLEPETRKIRVDPAGSRELFILGKSGMKSFQRGPFTVPFKEHQRVAVAFDTTLDAKGMKKIEDRWEVEGLGLVRFEIEVPAEIEAPELIEVPERKTRLYSFSNPKEDVGALVRELSFSSGVERAGMVISIDKWKDKNKNQHGTCSYLTDELVVRFKSGVSDRTARKIIKGKGYKILRRLPYAPDTYHLKSDQPATYELLAAINELHERPDVEWAEPNLGGTSELDSSWDRELIKTKEARDFLKKVGRPVAGQAAQGSAPESSAKVVLAIVDSGLKEAHGKLKGKVAELYDFRRMASGNKKLLYDSDHGMKVAGVATARAEGDPRVLGVAPECKVMGLIFPRTEVDILDMYAWAAGLDPKRRGWPDPPERGADVFITSVGFGCCAGAPISGLASQVFEKLTSEGRDKRGCLLFFSAGNRGRDCTFDRPWAASERAFGIAASTLAKERATYSGFGPVELCAASSYDRTTRDPQTPGSCIWTIDRDGSTYRFGGTSAATPLAAGVAALVLGARPELNWTEVRQILRLSAQKIGTGSSKPRRWLSADGSKTNDEELAIFSRQYGYGQVDAEKAVRQAALYPRHLGLKVGGGSAAARLAFGIRDPFVGLQIALGATFIVIAGLMTWWVNKSPGPAELVITLLLALAASQLIQAGLSTWLRRTWRDIFDDPAEGGQEDTSYPPSYP